MSAQTKKEAPPPPRRASSSSTETTPDEQTGVLHWADQAARVVLERSKDKEEVVVSSGITPSGTVHVGNFREVITVDLVARAIRDAGKQVRFIYSWDDYDPLRKVPKNLPKQDLLKTYLGKPISETPDTTGTYRSFAERNEKEFEQYLPLLGIQPQFIYQHERYTSCAYAPHIREALRARHAIRTILNAFRKEPLPQDWFPLSIFCEACKTNKTRVVNYDEEYAVTYTCDCGHTNTFDFRTTGICKLPWRVDWPMRWHAEGVDFEPGGKDHFTAGGSYDSASQIIRTVWSEEPPYGFMYEWIAIKGGGEFASSSGNVLTLHDLLAVYEPPIIRYLFAGTRPGAKFNISFDLDVIKIYEDFDRCERIYYGAQEAKNEKEAKNMKRIYELSCVNTPAKTLPFQPPFRHVTTVLQLYEGDIEKTTNHFQDSFKTDQDRERTRLRVQCAKNWLERHAPESMRFSVQNSPPPDVLASLTPAQKAALKRVAALVSTSSAEEEIHKGIYEIAKEENIPPRELFQKAYLCLIGKERGPRLASFLKLLGPERVQNIFSHLS
ncbi:lysine--tRNA ligase [Candidatus Woesearchaeota archaeon]|nr:MAG: lysine--tRNA ligase [Candidatus Woesearchaeota archaeon]